MIVLKKTIILKVTRLTYRQTRDKIINMKKSGKEKSAR
jgi:hypothetical protein